MTFNSSASSVKNQTNIINKLTENDLVGSSNGLFRGLVLHVDQTRSNDGSDGSKFRCCIYVSPFHDNIPIPLGYAVYDNLTPRQRSILNGKFDAIGWFRPQYEDAEAPSVGDIAWCTYSDIYHMEDGIFIGRDRTASGSGTSTIENNTRPVEPQPDVEPPPATSSPATPSPPVRVEQSRTGEQTIGESTEERRVKIALGLPAWAQSGWAQQDRQYTLERAYKKPVEEGLRLGVREFRWWSSKWIVPISLGGVSNPRIPLFTPNPSEDARRAEKRRIFEELNLPDDVTTGIWFDIHPFVAQDPAKRRRYIQYLKELGFTTAAVMCQKMNMHSGSPAYRRIFNDEVLRGIGNDLRESGFTKIIAVTWPRPNRTQIDLMTEDAPSLLNALGTNMWEVDCEKNWRLRQWYQDPNHPRLSKEEAGNYLVTNMRNVVNNIGVVNGNAPEIEMTTVPQHPENGSNAKVAPFVDQLNIQAYSLPRRGGTTIRFNDRNLGPGGIQNLSVRNARRIPGAYTPADEE